MTPKQRRIQIMQEVSLMSGVPVELILSRCRTKKVCWARNELMRRLYALHHYSLPQIGRIVGRDHSTVCYAVGLLKRKPSRPKWRRPRIKHLHCHGCRFCLPTAEPVETAPRRLKVETPRDYLIPYAGFDPIKYRPKERPS